MSPLPPSVLARLDIPVNRRLHGNAGTRPGRRAGAGSELLSARPYAEGDDPRQVDWNATARTGALHVKATLADIAMDVHLVLDASGSMRFGTAQRKWESAVQAAELFSLIARRGHEPVTVHLAAEAVQIVPLPSGRHGIAHVRALAEQAPAWDRPGSVGAAVTHLADPRWRPAAVIVLTDMHLSAADMEAIGRAAVRHSVTIVQVLDPAELDLPALGVVSMVGCEGGGQVRVDTSDASLRARYAAAVSDRLAGVADAAAGHGVEVLRVSTGEEVTVQLARQLPRR